MALAVLRTRPPGAAGAHPRRSSSRAPRPGTRSRSTVEGGRARATARSPRLQLRRGPNTGAYGNHAPGVMFHGCGESLARLPLPEQEGRRLRGLHEHRAVRRVPRLRAGADRSSPSSRRWTSSPGGSAWTRSSSGRRNIVRPGDALVSTPAEPERRRDRQLRAGPVPRPRRRRRWRAAAASPAAGRAGSVGERHGAGDDRHRPAAAATSPTRAIAAARTAAYAAARSARPSSATAPRPCTPSSRRTALGATVDRVEVRQSDTDLVAHDTGAYGSTGTVVARAMADAALPASRGAGAAAGRRDDAAATRRRCSTRRRVGSARRHPALGGLQRPGLPGRRQPATGEIRILQQRAGRRRRHGHQPGAVPRPGRGRRRAGARRGAVRGGRRSTSRPGDHAGAARVPRPATRRRPAHRGASSPHCRPARAARRQVDERGPFNPVAPALANAIRDATGVRLPALPLTRDRVWLKRYLSGEQHGAGWGRTGTARPRSGSCASRGARARRAATSIRDCNVSTSLSGDLARRHLTGDNAKVLATDTQKNTVYAFAQRLGDVEPEVLALRAGAALRGERSSRSPGRGWRSRSTRGSRLGAAALVRPARRYVRATPVVHDAQAGDERGLRRRASSSC